MNFMLHKWTKEIRNCYFYDIPLNLGADGRDGFKVAHRKCPSVGGRDGEMHF